jgi:hypothetical protein
MASAMNAMAPMNAAALRRSLIADCKTPGQSTLLQQFSAGLIMGAYSYDQSRSHLFKFLPGRLKQGRAPKSSEVTTYWSASTGMTHSATERTVEITTWLWFFTAWTMYARVMQAIRPADATPEQRDADYDFLLALGADGFSATQAAGYVRHVRWRRAGGPARIREVDSQALLSLQNERAMTAFRHQEPRREQGGRSPKRSGRQNGGGDGFIPPEVWKRMRSEGICPAFNRPAGCHEKAPHVWNKWGKQCDHRCAGCNAVDHGRSDPKCPSK